MGWIIIAICVICFLCTIMFSNGTDVKEYHRKRLNDYDFGEDDDDDDYYDDDDFDDDDSYDSGDLNRADMTDKPLLQDGQEYFCGIKCIGCSKRKGYTTREIKGMGYRDLSLHDIGRFEGYAEAEVGNKYDPYAIAIYREDYTHVGYLPAGDFELHDYITDQGGYVHCIGYIACYNNGVFYGEVSVESDKDLVRVRNKLYDTEKFYVYSEGELLRFLEEQQA